MYNELASQPLELNGKARAGHDPPTVWSKDEHLTIQNQEQALKSSGKYGSCVQVSIIIGGDPLQNGPVRTGKNDKSSREQITIPVYLSAPLLYTGNGFVKHDL
ncbi:UNVERIFIED_CONTAM: hypothetical protein FKN15_034154 [Acipenser sinensis]